MRHRYPTVYVTCSVCGNNYAGKVPKGGDGSAMLPRLHYLPNLGFSYGPRKKVVCPGSYQPVDLAK